MKKTFTTGLSGAALLALFVLAIIHFTSCGRPANLPLRIVVPINWHDSSTNGSGTGLRPKVIFTNPGTLPAGSVFLVECASKDCAGIAGAAGSGASGSGAAQGNPKIIFECKIPYDLPANTEMSMSFQPAPGAKEQTSR